ncbi:MAG: DNA repair protein RecN [Clostridiales bacterium]|nr:DNA repair protein RecN [Clostridiales bacterium]MDO4351237.1 DNA repair protein RecN [Eubacteriales bacterium]MDY4009674.1 DNA repair protein RecN [Candidatus Limiplasma sp.]
MLVSMTVRNIALIENLQIDFHKGMNVLSGETGAGKSIIVDSINLVLGERADRGLIRSGCEKASVEALIDVSACPEAIETLKEQELEAEGGLLSIQREISIEGRNICRVCGVIVPLTYLRRLTALLVDIHGQHEHQSLLDNKNHMAFLDSFGEEGFLEQKQRVAQAYAAWRESSARFSALRKQNAQRVERQEYLTSRVRELDAAQLAVGEAEKLSAERARFASAERIDGAVRSAYELVMGGQREKSAMDKLRDACDAMRRIEELDARFKDLEARLSSAYYEVEETGIELRDILENESFDPARNEEIQERLDLIRKLERRYGMTADELAAHHEEMRDELQRLGGMEERLKRAETEYKKKLFAYRTEAGKLTEARKRLAASFEKTMQDQLKELGMQNTRFACVFEAPDPNQKKVPTSNGDDHVCFYIAPNPGEPLKPLDKTASGGELSRLMLAMKAAGADHDGIPCMIFDEIDTGISGHIASVVAQKMAAIARYHQVLCVTHLAQIAAMADAQFLVEKQVSDGRTHTAVTPLSCEGRVMEIARLIGVTQEQQESGVAHARAILSSAGEWKRKTSL